MHGGNEITLVCIKYTTEDAAKAYEKETDEVQLGRSLDREDVEHGIDTEIMSGFDEGKGSHFIEVKLYADIEDLEAIEAWGAAEGFEIVEKNFGSHV